LHEISHIKFLPRARPELVEGYLRALFIFDLSLSFLLFEQAKEQEALVKKPFNRFRASAERNILEK